MVKREFWINKIEQAWEKRSIVWLVGVRRVGKTSLCKSLDNVIYYDCERFYDKKKIEADYELFLTEHKGDRIVLDEIHKLKNPSEILKVAADHYPTVKIIATGSSVIQASSKFKDALTGRKTEIRLTPLLLSEGKLFGNANISHRMLYGGLPSFFMSKELPEYEYKEWLTDYWAQDIQELYRVEKRASFLKFTELLLAQSGNMFVGSRFSSPCEISTPTVFSYLDVTKDSFLATVVRPFSNHALTEIRSTPKVYGFDTGFVCHMNGWFSLRESDYGILWEHIVLNELTAHMPYEAIHYWRDKRGHEIDFVIMKNRKQKPVAIECKWKSQGFNAKNMIKFRELYPEGTNYLVASDIDASYRKKHDEIIVKYISIEELITELLIK